jgi:hypothetical protein
LLGLLLLHRVGPAGGAATAAEHGDRLVEDLAIDLQRQPRLEAEKALADEPCGDERDQPAPTPAAAAAVRPRARRRPVSFSGDPLQKIRGVARQWRRSRACPARRRSW